MKGERLRQRRDDQKRTRVQICCPLESRGSLHNTDKTLTHFFGMQCEFGIWISKTLQVIQICSKVGGNVNILLQIAGGRKQPQNLFPSSMGTTDRPCWKVPQPWLWNYEAVQQNPCSLFCQVSSATPSRAPQGTGEGKRAGQDLWNDLSFPPGFVTALAPNLTGSSWLLW